MSTIAASGRTRSTRRSSASASSASPTSSNPRSASSRASPARISAMSSAITMRTAASPRLSRRRPSRSMAALAVQRRDAVERVLQGRRRGWRLDAWEHEPQAAARPARARARPTPRARRLGARRSARRRAPRGRRRSRSAAGAARSVVSSSRTGTRLPSASSRSAASRPASVSDAGWMPCASARSSSSAARISSRARTTARTVAGRALQRHREGDQALLRAVVEVALEAPALGIANLDDARARGRQLAQARAQRRAGRAVLQRGPGGARGLGEPVGRMPEVSGVAQLRQFLASPHDIGDDASGLGWSDMAALVVDGAAVALRVHDGQVGISGARRQRGPQRFGGRERADHDSGDAMAEQSCAREFRDRTGRDERQAPALGQPDPARRGIDLPHSCARLVQEERRGEGGCGRRAEQHRGGDPADDSRARRPACDREQRECCARDRGSPEAALHEVVVEGDVAVDEQEVVRAREAAGLPGVVGRRRQGAQPDPARGESRARHEAVRNPAPAMQVGQRSRAGERRSQRSADIAGA